VRKIGVVTVARSDYGLQLPVIKAIQADPELELALIVAGMHLAPEFGFTRRDIEGDGFEIAYEVEMTVSSDSPKGLSISMGLGTIGFASAYEIVKPDMLVVLGDRFEMHAATSAAVPFGIPVAHIHGGESTEGAIDEQFRHSMTKMSHLHFATTELYAQRIRQMGEQPDRVFHVGSPGIDNIKSMELYTEKEFQRTYSVELKHPVLLVTFHPVTLEHEQTPFHVEQLLKALDGVEAQVIFTYPNADTMGRYIIRSIEEFREDRIDRVSVQPNLGQKGYLSLLGLADAMVGNSSSGLIEAPSFNLPVVNIGNRQKGRVRGSNVLDVGHGADEIISGINQALESKFRQDLTGSTNPYGDGHAAQRIVQVLRSVQVDGLKIKTFQDMEPNA